MLCMIHFLSCDFIKQLSNFCISPFWWGFCCS